MLKKVFFSIFLIAITLSVVCYASPPSDDYQLIFSDEFDGSDLNTVIWDYRSGSPYGGQNLKENVHVKDGLLQLDYKKVDDTYTGGGILTKSTLSYGYYEVRAKVFSGVNGLHTSFWTSGADAFKTKPENYPFDNCIMEIDAFEINSRDDDGLCRISYGTHYWYDYHINPYRHYHTETDTSKDWFVMGLEWLPDKTSFFVDGKLIGTFDTLPTYGLSYLWLTAVAMPENYYNGDGTYDIDDSKMDENGYFGSSYFDYFRYYQKPLKNVNLLTNPNFEYDRISEAFYPVGYILKGDKSASGIHKSSVANDGYVYHFHHSESPYSLSTGQELSCLLPGKYTFKGKFTASGEYEKARIAVYDKNGNTLAFADIPSSESWTEVSITDIAIKDYAYVAVESESNGNTMLKMDSLEFYIQSGEEYISNITPLYEKKLEEISQNSYYYSLKDATTYTGNWLRSTNEQNTYYLKGSLKDVEVVWEIPIYETDTYHIDLRTLIHPNNTPIQYYYIKAPEKDETKIEVDCITGETGWENIAKVPLKQGDTLKISMRSNKQKGSVRAGYPRLTADSEKTAFGSTVMKLNQPLFSHNNLPYTFGDLTPYVDNETTHIPYQALKDIYGEIENIDENSVYVTARQLESSGLGVTIKAPYVFIHGKDDTITERAYDTALDTLYSFITPPIYKTPQYIGTENAEKEIRYTYNDAIYHGTDWTNSKHITSHKYAKPVSHFAQWKFKSSVSGRYALEIFCPSHQNSETDTYISVTTNQGRTNYALDQTGTHGWYGIGILDLKEGENVSVKISKKDNYGLLRISDIRLVPLSPPEISVENLNVNINLGHSYFYTDTILMKEYTENSTRYQVTKPSALKTLMQLNDTSNSFVLFFWKNFTPITSPVEGN